MKQGTGMSAVNFEVGAIPGGWREVRGLIPIPVGVKLCRVPDDGGGILAEVGDHKKAGIGYKCRGDAHVIRIRSRIRMDVGITAAKIDKTPNNPITPMRVKPPSG